MHDTLLSSQYRDYKSIPDPLLTNSRLGAFAVRYLEAVEQTNKTPATFRIYSQVLRNFLQYDNVHILPPPEVGHYLLGIAKRACSPATVHVHYRTLKTWFLWLKVARL
jgi:hypothetical protein